MNRQQAKAETKPDISEAAVQTATGKGWEEWFRLLDEAGAVEMSHKEIVARLEAFENLSGWWRHSIAVAYEKARGLREKHEHADGYSVSASKTIQVSAEKVFAAWQDEKLRGGWLKEPITIRKSTPSKSLRITWHDGTHVDVYIYPKSDSKCQVSLEHRKLSNRQEADKQKAFWREALQALKESVEGPAQ